MTFEHKALKNANSIRLFTLHCGKFDDDLVGSVGDAAFLDKDCPAYNFLSYTWRDASEADASLPVAKSDHDWDPWDNSLKIKIKDQPFKIGHNLALALLHLRSPEYAQCFWIDAICLNLEDDYERSSQVCLMPAIVAQAKAVISWLGPDDPEQARTMRSDEDAWTRMKVNWGRGKVKFLPNLLGELASGNFDSTHRQFIPASLLGQKEYWSRTWVLHELCHARKVLFVSGRNVWWERDFDSHMDHFGTLPIVQTLNARRDRDKKLPLETLLLKYHTYESDNRLDLVYPLIGLSSDVSATATNHTQRALTATTLVEDADDQRRTNIVRFAALVQKAFRGLDPKPRIQMNLPTPLLVSLWDGIMAKGYFAGYVHHVGRSYRHIATSQGSYASGDYMPMHKDDEDKAMSRAFVEDYTTKVIGSRRLERAANLDNGLGFPDQTRGWALSEGTKNSDFAFTRACCIAAKRQEMPTMQTGELVQFIGTGNNVGFASSAARIEMGDRIIAFQGCHVGFIVRSLPGSSYLQIISKADVETAHRTEWVMEEFEAHGRR
ncbi:heterokaryon incompatibility protein-domain-containing protein [Colletotrichum cereale]|nr:heterokaryon incompatibility protein-domain-containing protein [Colletotrichum cereale]